MLQILSSEPILGSILVCLNLYGESYYKELPIEVIDRLVSNKYIKKTVKGFEFTNEGKTLFNEALKKPTDLSNYNLAELAKEFRELFPAGVKSGGYYVRVPQKEIEVLLDKFIKKYKFSPDVIIAATKRYIAEKRAVNWAYIQTANYFIFKNEKSALAAYCDNLDVEIQNDDDWTKHSV